MVEPLRNPKNLEGFNKRWPAKGATEYALLHDYLLKVNYSIQDFNSLIEKEAFPSREDIILMVVYADWISDAIYRIPSCYKDGILDSFQFSNQDSLKKAHSYLQAVRSIVVAHPLATDRHHAFGFNGDLICIDLGRKARLLDMMKPPFTRISLGKEPERVDRIPETDCVMRVYSKRKGAIFSEHIGFSLEDIRTVAALKIDLLYEMNKFLSKLRREGFPGM